MMGIEKYIQLAHVYAKVAPRPFDSHPKYMATLLWKLQKVH